MFEPLGEGFNCKAEEEGGEGVPLEGASLDRDWRSGAMGVRKTVVAEV